MDPLSFGRPIGPSVTPRWTAPDVDYAPGLEVGDEVTVVVRAKVVRKRVQSGSFATIVDVVPMVGDSDSVSTLTLWPDASWRTTLDSPRSLILLDTTQEGDEPTPIITIERTSR